MHFRSYKVLWFSFTLNQTRVHLLQLVISYISNYQRLCLRYKHPVQGKEGDSKDNRKRVLAFQEEVKVTTTHPCLLFLYGKFITVECLRRMVTIKRSPCCFICIMRKHLWTSTGRHTRLCWLLRNSDESHWRLTWEKQGHGFASPDHQV